MPRLPCLGLLDHEVCESRIRDLVRWVGDVDADRHLVWEFEWLKRDPVQAIHAISCHRNCSPSSPLCHFE